MGIEIQGREQDLQLFAICTLLWSALFILVRLVLLRKRTFDFCNRTVSVVHVFVAFYLSSRSINDWRHPLANIGEDNTPFQNKAIIISLGYFVYDFFCCLLAPTADLESAVHHVITILGLGHGILAQKSGTELLVCLWLMELSNPFMHARELLKELGFKDSPLALLNDVLFALIFTFARIIIGTLVTWATVSSTRTALVVKVGAVGILVVSLFWWFKILRVVHYKLFKKKVPKGSKRPAFGMAKKKVAKD